MTSWNQKVRVAVGNVSLELPNAVPKRQDAPIDSAASVFEGGGVTVIVDQSPFADRLDSLAGLPEYREEVKNVGGTIGRMVFFHSPDRSMYTVGIHLPAPAHVTIVVQADASVPERIPREIVGSLRLLN